MHFREAAYPDSYDTDKPLIECQGANTVCTLIAAAHIWFILCGVMESERALE